MPIPTGMLSEGPQVLCIYSGTQLINQADGIHVDMNHLKTGEVK